MIWVLVNIKNGMGEVCSQAFAVEFTIGSLIFIQVAMSLKIWVVRGYQYNIVAPVMAAGNGHQGDMPYCKF